MQHMKKYLGVAVCGLFTLVATSANAQSTVLTEDFNYADGPLATANPAWVDHSGTVGTLGVVGGAAEVKISDPGGASEDLHKLFDGGAAFSSGVVTASFDIRVISAAPITSNADDEYFAHFWQTANPFNFRSRTFVHAPTAGGDYTLSISVSSSSVSTDLPTDFNFGDTVPVSISFDIDAGTSSLTAGGNTVFDLNASTGQVIDAFAFRQAFDNNNVFSVFVDNLVVTHVPEPSTFALIGGLLVLGLTVVRRRRR